MSGVQAVPPKARKFGSSPARAVTSATRHVDNFSSRSTMRRNQWMYISWHSLLQRMMQSPPLILEVNDGIRLFDTTLLSTHPSRTSPARLDMRQETRQMGCPFDMILRDTTRSDSALYCYNETHFVPHHDCLLYPSATSNITLRPSIQTALLRTFALYRAGHVMDRDGDDIIAPPAVHALTDPRRHSTKYIIKSFEHMHKLNPQNDRQLSHRNPL